MAHCPVFDRSRIHRVVWVYTVVAALWILLSDKVVGWLFSSPSQLVLASTFKGWVFIVVTALLLYSMLLQQVRSDALPLSEAPPVRGKGWPFALLALLVLCITALGVAHSISEERGKEVARVQAIADIKSRQISDWLQERQDDAAMVRANQAYAAMYQRWQQGNDQESRDQLFGSLRQLCQIGGYSAVTLFDGQGQRLWGTGPTAQDTPPILLNAVQQAQASLQVERIGPYLNPLQRPSLDFVAPLLLAQGVPAVVVLHTASSDWINPTLKSWPVPSRSGETLLFRRDGQRVVFLNDVRHLPHAALQLQLPVSSPGLLAAQFLRGEVRAGELISGRDYRNVAVIGVVRPIAHTDWFLLAKMDQSELYSTVFSQVSTLGLAGVLAFLVAAAAWVVVRQRAALRRAEQVQQSQSMMLQSLQLLAAVADSSEDPIFAKDLQGRYLLFNRAACAALECSVDDVLGQDDYTLFPAGQAEAIQRFEREVIAADCVLTTEEHVSLPHGDRVFLATKGPLKNEEGQCIGIFGISRDITERNAAEQAQARQAEELRLRNAELERMNQAMIGRELDMLALKQQINLLSLRLGLPAPYEQAALLSGELDAGQPGEEE